MLQFIGQSMRVAVVALVLQCSVLRPQEYQDTQISSLPVEDTHMLSIPHAAVTHLMCSCETCMIVLLY